MRAVTTMSTARWQFTIRHMLLLILLLSALFGSIAYARLFGAVLFAGACGVACVVRGLRKYDGRYLIPGAILTIVSLGLLLAGSTVSIGDGHTRAQCTFQVVDIESELPVSGANVRIRDVSRHGHPEGVAVDPIPTGEPGVEGLTGQNGIVTLPYEFWYSDKRGLFVDEAYIYISADLWLQVDAPEYGPILIRLDTLTGRLYDWSKLPIPTMRIKLKPLASHVQ